MSVFTSDLEPLELYQVPAGLSCEPLHFILVLFERPPKSCDWQKPLCSAGAPIYSNPKENREPKTE